MCNLYSHRKSQDELRQFIKGLKDRAGSDIQTWAAGL
jgi:hypothetical protein